MMLTLIRDCTRSLIGKVIMTVVALTFIGAAFALWSGDLDPQYAYSIATVGDIEISRKSYQLALDRAREETRRDFQERGQSAPTEEIFERLQIDEIAYRSLLDNAVLNYLAARAGIEIPDQVTRDYLVDIDQFKDEAGRFDRARYLELLRYAQLTPTQFEEEARADLRASLMRRLISGAFNLSDEEILATLRSLHEKSAVSHLKVRFDSFDKEIDLSDEPLKKWYESNSYPFLEPEKRKAIVLSTDYRLFTDEIKIDEKELDDILRARLESGRETEEVKARHILIKPSDDAESKIEAIYEKLKSGADFAAVARQESADRASAVNGGDLGFFGRGAMVDEFESVVFALDEGEISKPFETRFGWHIAQTIEKKGAIARDEADLRKELKAELVKARARKLAKVALEEAIVNLAAKDFRDAAAKIKDKRIKAESITLSVDEVGQANSKVDAALGVAIFSLMEDEISELVESGDRFAVAVTDQIIEPSAPPFSEAREKARALYLDRERKRLARERADEIIGAARSGEKLEEIAQRYALKLTKTPPFALSDIFNSDGAAQGGRGAAPSSDETLIKRAATLKLAEGDLRSIEGPDGYIVYRIDAKSLDAKGVIADESATRERLELIQPRRIYSSFIEGVKERAFTDGVIVDRRDQIYRDR